MVSRSSIIITTFGIVIFMWWSFFSKPPTKEADALYPEEHFLEDISQIYSDIGSAAFNRGDFTKAIKTYQEAVSMRPSWLEAYDHLGIAYELNNQPQEAFQTYAHATSINSDFIDFRTKLTSKKTLHKNKSPLVVPHRSLEWTGQNLENKKIFIYAEKTVESTLLFSRFLTKLKEKALKIYFKPQEILVSLIKQAKFGIVICNNHTNIADLDVDYHASLLSVLHYLTPSVTSLCQDSPYLKSNFEKNAQFQKEFFNSSDLKIGIAWAEAHNKNKNSIVTPGFFSPLTQIPKTKVFSFQKPTNQADAHILSTSHIVDLSSKINNYSDLVSALENLDIFITADETTAIIAGALGKKTWFVIPGNSPWYWLEYWEKNKTIWFSNFKKISQPHDGCWKQSLAIIHKKICKKLAKSNKSQQ